MEIAGILNKQFTLSETYGMLQALAASENRLWAYVKVVEESGSKKLIFEVDPESESVVNKMGLPENISSSSSGITYLDGHLWLVSGLIKKEVLKIDPQSGEIVMKHDYTGRVINGIATDGENIFLADGEKHVLLTLKK